MNINIREFWNVYKGHILGISIGLIILAIGIAVAEKYNF